MKKFMSKKFIVITAVALLLFVTVGSTLAYIFDVTKPVENTFTPSKVSCAVVETVNGKEKENEAGAINSVTTKEDVKIRNTGDTDAYIRVAVVVKWVNKDGKVWATEPKRNEYTINFILDKGWVADPDSYYYYSEKVAPNGLTSELIDSVTQNVAGPVGIDGTQYYLSVEIVASAIQADGIGATSALDAWDAALGQTG